MSRAWLHLFHAKNVYFPLEWEILIHFCGAPPLYHTQSFMEEKYMKKHVLITGASGGIGQAIALKLAEEGYSLYLHYHQNEAGILELMERLKDFPDGEYIPIQADLANPKGYKRVADNIFAIDAIVHNSGTSLYGLLVDLNDDALEQLLTLHVKTPMLLTKELLPKMLSKRDGNIIVVSSIWGQTGAACEVAY